MHKKERFLESAIDFKQIGEKYFVPILFIDLDRWGLFEEKELVPLVYEELKDYLKHDKRMLTLPVLRSALHHIFDKIVKANRTYGMIIEKEIIEDGDDFADFIDDNGLGHEGLEELLNKIEDNIYNF